MENNFEVEPEWNDTLEIEGDLRQENLETEEEIAEYEAWLDSADEAGALASAGFGTDEDYE